jgi:hypothetical protein
MIQIIDRLYLGNREAACDRDRLRAAGVTHILNCAAELPCYFEGEFVYKSLGLRDPDPTFPDRLADACAFLDEARRRGKVLVHCFAAISRSPAVILTYLCHLGDTLERAARRLGEVVWTDPDRLFLAQLAAHLGVACTEADLEQLALALRGGEYA